MEAVALMPVSNGVALQAVAHDGSDLVELAPYAGKETP